jgi:two-component system KDP operon response regulator KdpE
MLAGRILIVEKDHATRRRLHQGLFEAQFDVVETESFEQACALCGSMRPDVMLLHVDIWDKELITDFTVLRSEAPTAAMIVLEECGDPHLNVKVLDFGADDCLKLPVHIPELIARIRAAVRRARALAKPVDGSITIGDFTLDANRQVVFRAGEPVHLTPKEFSLLRCLMLHAPFPVRHAELLDAVWGPGHAGEVHLLRRTVRRVRMKLADNPSPRYLLTEDLVGYRFQGEAHEPAPRRVP